MFVKLAWRNLWRNRRRTFITMASVFFAVILSTLMMSFKEGVYIKMIESMIGSFTGYGQIHANGYWEDKTLDNSLVFNDSLVHELEKTENLAGFAPRVESFALAASDEVTKGTMVVGVSPEKELQHTSLHERVTQGEYFSADDQSVLMGADLGESLKLSIGDTVVLLGQGYHGASAAGKYPVKGFVKFGSPELSKRLVFLPIKEAQWLYGTEGMITSLVLLPEKPSQASKIVSSLKKKIGDNYEVMTWQELSPELVNMIETDRVEGYVFMFILYMVISFGILGTILMMLSERRREFGVLVAIGMKRFQLSIVVFLEVITIAIIGAFMGMLGAFPVCYYFYKNPISFGADMGKMMEDYGFEPVLQSSIEPYIFIQQAVVVALIGSVIAIYPLLKINRLNAINAMRA